MTKKFTLLSIFMSLALILSGCSDFTKAFKEGYEEGKQEAKKEASEEKEKKEEKSDSEVASSTSVDTQMNSEDYETIPFEEIRDAVYVNNEYMNDEDLEGYLSTLYLTEEQKQEQAVAIQQLFDAYTLFTVISNMEIVEANETSALVRLTQKTSKMAGPEYRNNETILLHELIKDEGQWKISNSTIEQTTYLD